MKPDIIVDFAMPCVFASANKGNCGKHRITVGLTNNKLVYFHSECDDKHTRDLAGLFPNNQSHCGTYRKWLLAHVQGLRNSSYLEPNLHVTDDYYVGDAFRGEPLGFIHGLLADARREKRYRIKEITKAKTASKLCEARTNIVQAYSNSAMFSVFRRADGVLFLGTSYDSTLVLSEEEADDPVFVSARIKSVLEYYDLSNRSQTLSRSTGDNHFCVVCRGYTTKPGPKHIASRQHLAAFEQVLKKSFDAFVDLTRPQHGGVTYRANKFGLMNIATPFYLRRTAGNLERYQQFYGNPPSDVVRALRAIQHNMFQGPNWAIKEFAVNQLRRLGYTKIDMIRFLNTYQEVVY